eukprot:m.20030 g.20030  ORF g.20030 m.20030 type:complete len:75 (+) comp10990_c0_seq1:771-995(+)
MSFSSLHTQFRSLAAAARDNLDHLLARRCHLRWRPALPSQRWCSCVRRALSSAFLEQFGVFKAGKGNESDARGF